MLVNVIPNIYDYALIFSFSVAVFYFILNIHNKGIPLGTLIISAFSVVFLSFTGARLMWALDEFPNVDIRDILYFGFGGFRLLGAVIFAILAIIIMALVFKKLYNFPIQDTLGISLESIFVEFTLAKFACFLEGCCYGIETTLPWGMDFGDGILRHPTQMYETLALLMIFFVLIIVRNKLSASSKYCLAIFLYVITRMLIEPLRDEADLFINGPTRIIYYVLLIGCALFIFKDKIYNFYASKLKKSTK